MSHLFETGFFRKTLGIVSTQYHPLQNLKAFQWFNFLLHEGSASLEAAGALKGGKRIWVLARVNQDELEVKDGDTVKPYLLLSNSHDGTSAVWIQFTVIRTVCWNTLSAALSTRYSQERQQTAIRIRHSASLDKQLAIASNALDFARQQFTHSVAQYRALTKQRIEREQFEAYVAKVLQVDDPLATRAQSNLDKAEGQHISIEYVGNRIKEAISTVAQIERILSKNNNSLSEQYSAFLKANRKKYC